ncbi:hypothetical protein QLH51_03660 [Sphingomonas sp. 2R-10]|uniref:hypothetical protein n=1 Tax=Sphingomonas sp. 2R-10 TaxID=3045148 RepID=UPI000F76E88F|nr:hypothetical protein [Sphingomonas sp. 2R-10]MDJ0275898.1 hypothetical protein [Sphingomonas sp. 2R-10]
MKTHAAALVLAASLTTTACDAAPAGGKKDGRPQAMAPTSTSPARPLATDAPPPTARDILRAGWDGAENGRYDADRKVYVDSEPGDGTNETGVWHRLPFTSGGRSYFTGFTAMTQVEAAEAHGARKPVSLGQATFVLEDGRWRAVDSGFVGELAVNASGNPARIDMDQSGLPPPHRVEDGRMLFALRLSDFAQGTTLGSHAVLLFDPRGMKRSEARKRDYPNGGWSLVAVLPTGSDNAAACDGGAVMTCAADRGTIRFEAAGTDLPDIRVRRAGTEIVAPGKVRHLGPDNTVLYRYDTARDEYVVRRER